MPTSINADMTTRLQLLENLPSCEKSLHEVIDNLLSPYITRLLQSQPLIARVLPDSQATSKRKISASRLEYGDEAMITVAE
ncbi:hypothetical protein Trco_007191 [Trichoderma cornu-damae]|uniref:Uncharacterized protein n=1 Tax=Trichoderma cornu-damae TaxID=654480 RepID=A0A9P8QFI2_9HYPO|nr:hypothetical protein Trco_007191 [Trichoderma cornu-damae]